MALHQAARSPAQDVSRISKAVGVRKLENPR